MLKVNKGHNRDDTPTAVVIEAQKGLPKIKREKVVIAEDDVDMPAAVVIETQKGLPNVKRENGQDEGVEIILSMIFFLKILILQSRIHINLIFYRWTNL